MRPILFSCVVVVGLWMGGMLLPGCMSDLNQNQLRCTETEGCPSGYVCRNAASGVTGMCCKANDLNCGVQSDASVMDSKVTDAGIFTDVLLVEDVLLAEDMPPATDVPEAEDVPLTVDATLDEGQDTELDSAGEDIL